MQEHDVVRLRRTIRQGSVLVSTGTSGTIVSIFHDNGQVVGYTVELRTHEPVALLDVQPDDVEPERSEKPPRRTEPWLRYVHLRNAAFRVRRRGVVEWKDLSDAQQAMVLASGLCAGEIPPEVMQDPAALRDWLSCRMTEARQKAKR